MPAGFRRHFVGKTLINVFTVIVLKYFFWQDSDHTDIFINERIECYLNNTITLRPLTPHIMPCYTHKMAIVSWPYILWRHFTLHIQWERLSTVQPTIGPRTAEDKTRQNKTKYCDVFAMKLFAALNSEYRILSETADTTTHCHLLSRLSSESFFATDVSFLILGGFFACFLTCVRFFGCL